MVVVGPWCKVGEPGLYSISYFQKLFDKNEVPKLSLFDIKLKKRIKKRSTHSFIILFVKIRVPQLSLFEN